MRGSLFWLFRILAFLITIFFQGPFIYSQSLKPADFTWDKIYGKGLFKDSLLDFSDTTRIRHQDKIYFLVKMTKTNFPKLSKLQNAEIKHQFDNDNYIIKTSLLWVNQNKGLFEHISFANNKWKLSSKVIRTYETLLTIRQGQNRRRAFMVYVKNKDSLLNFLANHSNEMSLEKAYSKLNIFRIHCNYTSLLREIIVDENIIFVEDGERMPKVESDLGGFDNSLNSINAVHAYYPQLMGENLNVSIKENEFDTKDLDLLGRNVSNTLSSGLITAHATNMATIIGGLGNSYPIDLGGVPSCSLLSSNFGNLLPDVDTYGAYHITVQNHSYGVGIENYYGADASSYDSSTIAFPKLVHIFSSGNSGDSASSNGIYNGVSGYANLTGSFKMSKNSISIGATDSFAIVSPLSSKGPAYDGRVKPELVAFGTAGTSAAAAMGSSVALLLQDAYEQKYPGQLPDNALVKAIMINSANDIGAEGIDFASGYGSINAFRAVKNIIKENYFSGTIRQGQDQVFTLQVPPNAKNLKITLVWNDPPALPGAYKSLMNDLDLSLKTPSSGQNILPWVLNSSPFLDSINLLPHRAKDSLNVVEQISLNTVAEGNYTLHVNGYKLATAFQSFYVTYQWDTINTFHWVSPTKNDNIFSGKTNIFRWESNYKASQTGILEISLDQGLHWATINSTINLTQPYFSWVAPDTFTRGIARMIINSTIFPSDTFVISSPLPLEVGFDCPDSVLVKWNSLNGANAYNIYSLEGNSISLVKRTNQNYMVLAKNKVGYPYFAVAPLSSNGLTGIRSYTINSTLQGLNCYVKSFLADLQTNNVVDLQLNLGSTYHIQSITFQKRSVSGWRDLTTLATLQLQLNYVTNDSVLQTGVNVYRAKLSLMDGSILFTGIDSVYLFRNDNFLVYPNPILKEQSLTILSKDYTYPHDIKIYNFLGSPVLEKTSLNAIDYIPMLGFTGGIYIIIIEEKGKMIYNKKIVIK